MNRLGSDLIEGLLGASWPRCSDVTVSLDDCTELKLASLMSALLTVFFKGDLLWENVPPILPLYVEFVAVEVPMLALEDGTAGVRGTGVLCIELKLATELAAEDATAGVRGTGVLCIEP